MHGVMGCPLMHAVTLAQINDIVVTSVHQSGARLIARPLLEK